MRQLLLAVILLSLPPLSAAALRVEITQGLADAIPIAVVPFSAGGNAAPPLDVAEVVERDLAWTGQFRLLPRSDMLERPGTPEAVNFNNWRAVKADHIVVGQMLPASSGYRIRFSVLDVYRPDRRAASFEVDATAKDLRLAGHTIANRVYEVLTGHQGIFTTRIAYVTATQTSRGPRYELVIADYDGYNPRSIATSPESIMSPAWSPDGTKIAYVTFDIDAGKSLLQIQDLASGGTELISDRAGINGAPAWSPNGRHLAMTLSTRGNPDVYVYDVRSRKLNAITQSPAIDTEPAWSPDGNYLVYTSDRGGRAQIYRAPAQGGKEERLTFEGKSNTRAVYSPDGENIAMVHQAGGYKVAVMDLKTRSLRIITAGPLDESPSFAPNGRALIYAHSAGGRVELATVSVDGRVKTSLRQRGAVREPAWSPFGR
ncbi:MAG: Tol-Pal system beta propeller repeat protein TolB [Nevskiales bacterium]